MNVIGVACVRDEVDIIEAFVRHNLACVQRLIVLDHGSTDGTRDVLEALQGEGLALDILSDPSPGKNLSKRMTMLMRDHAVRRWDADWVLPLDADELIAVSGDEPLVPEGAAGDQPLRLTWLSYVPDARDDAAELNPVVRIRHRLNDQPGQRIVKLLVPRQWAGHAGAVLGQGSHELLVDGRPCATAAHDRVCLAHFPVRSRGQFVAKTVIGHLQNLAVAFHDPRWGVHHRNYFEMLQHQRDVFVGDFPSWLRAHGVYQFFGAATGVADPLPYRGGPLRYTPCLDEAAQSWKPILTYAQDLARRYGVLQASLTEDQRLSLEQQLDMFAYFRRQLDQRERQIEHQLGQASHWQHHCRLAEQRLELLEQLYKQQLQAAEQRMELVQQLCQQQLQTADSRVQMAERQRQEQVYQAQVQLQTTTQQLQEQVHHAQVQLQTTTQQLRAAERRGQTWEQQQQDQLSQAQVQLQLLTQQLHATQAQLEVERQHLDRAYRQSWTWRIGRLSLWPARLLRRGWHRCRRN
jgi:hypothetical protein